MKLVGYHILTKLIVFCLVFVLTGAVPAIAQPPSASFIGIPQANCSPVIVNFYDQPIDTHIHIPAEAFQYLSLKEGDYYSAKNLLNDDEEFPIQRLISTEPYKVFMPAWQGKLLKLKKEKVY